jgi:arylsulfatase A-like enzyme
MRDILFVTVDSLRADHVGAYGYNRETSPYLDSLAESGYRFTNGFAHAGMTRASFPAILSSTYPPMYGGLQQISAERTLISEVLDDGGYNTGGFHSNPFLSSDFGYDRGFDTLFDSQTDPTLVSRIRDFAVKNLPRNTKLFSFLQTIFNATEKHAGVEMGSAYVRADELTDRSIQWLDQTDDSQTFLWTHYMDVHHPYLPPATHQKAISGEVVDDRRAIQLRRKMLESPEDITDAELQTLVNLYDAEIRFVDEQVQRLVEAARSQLDDPVVIFTADHGEEFREHGQFSHNTVHDEGTHVPLIIEDGSGTGNFDEMVGLMDLPPTMASYAEQSIPQEYLGYDIRTLIGGEGWEREAVIGTWGSVEEDRLWFFYRDPEWLFINQDGEELYNVLNDPEETNNVVGEHPDVLEEIREKISECEQEIRASHRDLDSVAVDDDVNQRLKMLGYKDE